MKGSEKQIKWAEDIKKNFYHIQFNELKRYPNETPEEAVEAQKKALMEDEEAWDLYCRIMAVEDAAWWIDRRYDLENSVVTLVRKERKGRFTV